jgi:FlaA1/EpsC-like NDP-sugar epimerase
MCVRFRLQIFLDAGLALTHPQEYFAGKVVLVTGAGGSIGSEICRKLAELGVEELRAVGHSELPLYELKKRVPQARTTLASVLDGKAMAQALEGVDIVIHAAAHKHVPLCEQNPIEAIHNNVGGTITMAELSVKAGVKQFVLVSSDKAVKPASIMGATKRACEIFLDFLATRSTMKCTTVRFGNVLDSSGSVLPLWREQIRQGKPITLTDKRCTRYFMSIPEAVDLTLSAATLPRGGLFVLDMGKPISLYDMAVELLAQSSMPGEITYTGLRPGEKLEEELSYGGTQVKTAFPKVMRVEEDGVGRVLYWSDFSDLLMACMCKHRRLSTEKLWEIVR